MLTPSSLLLVAKLGTSTSPGTSAPRPLLFLRRLAIPPPVLGGSAPLRGGKGSVIACGPWVRYAVALGVTRGIWGQGNKAMYAGAATCAVQRSQVNKQMSQGECSCCYARGGSRTKSCKTDPGQDCGSRGSAAICDSDAKMSPRSHRSICGLGKGLLCQQSDCVADCIGAFTRMMSMRMWSVVVLNRS